MRKEHFIASRFFIYRLADLEKQRLELEKQFRETLSLWNKDKDEMLAPLPNLNQWLQKGNFFKEVTVDKHDRFALVFFILNTLHQLQDSDRWYCYCSEIKSFWTKIISKGVPCWLPSRCQICVIPETFNLFIYFLFI